MRGPRQCSTIAVLYRGLDFRQLGIAAGDEGSGQFLRKGIIAADMQTMQNSYLLLLQEFERTKQFLSDPSVIPGPARAVS